MGKFLQKGNDGFRAVRNGEFVDKSGLIHVINSTLNTERQFNCVSRARRFGKSITAKMLYAYYDQWCDSKELFQDLQIAHTPSFQQHFQRYPVLYLDMTDFMTRYAPEHIVNRIQLDVIAELREIYPDLSYPEDNNLADALYTIASQPNQEKFIVIIDEWDAPLRELPQGSTVVDEYITLLRGLFKSTTAMSTFAGVYMTGILPIKKYNTQSALNNFHEYSMVQPGPLAECFGFTVDEVKDLCEKHQMNYAQLAEWYDGYQIGGSKGMFNPTSVMAAIYNDYCDSYWANTSAYDTVATYIRMDFDGLQEGVIRLLAGESCSVETASFQNDLNIVRSKDDVLTSLIHLGYLSYDREQRTCHIPNREVATEFKNAIVSDSNWGIVATAIQQSEQLLNATLDGKEAVVAAAIDAIHSDATSVLQYNDENSLACVLTLAYYTSQKDYMRVRELPTGKGFADIVLIPRPNCYKPAVVLELKYDQSADTAIAQIHEKRYAGMLKDFAGEVVLVGINYDKATKKHECRIEWV
ncbi:MAG: AAA family ATPase [Paludibacteraceae bacterium]|nr:AAA family ATPase [Paludibacteraceae bacterium]